MLPDSWERCLLQPVCCFYWISASSGLSSLPASGGPSALWMNRPSCRTSSLLPPFSICIDSHFAGFNPQTSVLCQCAVLKTCEVHVCVNSSCGNPSSLWSLGKLGSYIFTLSLQTTMSCFNAHVCYMLDMRVRGLALGDLPLCSNYVLAASSRINCSEHLVQGASLRLD